MNTIHLVSKLNRIALFSVAFFLLLSPLTGAYAACCAGHGGVASCNKSTGFQICKDGTASPSCTCAKAKGITAKTPKEKAAKVKALKAKTAETTTETTNTTTTKPSGWWWGKKSTTKPAKTSTTGTAISAKGCCSRHGGVAQCNKATGHQMCKDGTVSVSCSCR